MPESPTKGDPNSTASTTGSSMILMHSSGPSASKPLHDNTAKREQNLHYGYYNGLTNNGSYNGAWIDHRQAHLDPCRDLSFGSACHGRRWIDDDSEQLRAEGNHGSARSRDQ